MQILYENKIDDTLIFQANKEKVKEINLHLLKKIIKCILDYPYKQELNS